jgi:hypothetical protein
MLDEDPELLGIFSDREKALAYAKEYMWRSSEPINSQRQYNRLEETNRSDWYRLVEYEVNKGYTFFHTPCDIEY